MKKKWKSLIVLFVIWSMVSTGFLGIPHTVYAEETKPEITSSNEDVEIPVVEVSPLAEDTELEDVILNDLQDQVDEKEQEEDTEEDTEEYLIDTSAVVCEIREAMANREESLTVNFRCIEQLDNDWFDSVMKDVFEETGISNQGDYLKWSHGGYAITYQPYAVEGGYGYYIDFYFSYYTTKAQEDELAEAINAWIEELGFTESTTDYEKVKAIYNYMCENITYDYLHVNDESYELQYTAYAALIHKTAVCQGYATLMYRVLHEVGIDSRIMTGISGNEGHAWNIALLGNYYYYLDSTWDAGSWVYSYFLRNEAGFADHYLDEEFKTEEFRQRYPISDIDYDPNMGPNTVVYQTHVQTYGWQSWVANGSVSGTEGEAKRLEGIHIKLWDPQYSGGITYRTHVQSYGWQGWKSDGEMSGTSGEAKRLEAIQIKLTGEMAEHYDVYYRVHAQSYGWLDWAKNGASAGTSGYGKRLEAIEIKLVEKDGEAPGETAKPYMHPLVQYRTHVQSFGWQGWKQDGELSGTEGLAKRLEGIDIKLNEPDYEGGITYRTHVQTYGWQDWKTDGEMSGTSGEAKRLEAIQIKLTGEMAKYYDVYYSVHAQTYGWLDWAKNGEEAGTSGLGKRLESILIVLVEKGGEAPGATTRPYIKK